MKQLSVFLGIALAWPILAADFAKPTATESHTQRVDFPAGGVLRLNDSFGEVTIEGWDQPTVEVTATKSAYSGGGHEKALLNEVQIAAKVDGNAVVISTVRPHRGIFKPTHGVDDIDIDYSIKVPRTARIEVTHGHGEVNIEGVAGDIRAASTYGPIVLRLPADGHYAINAHSSLGNVYSDFYGDEKHHHLFAESFVGAESAAPQKLNLKVGMGDVIILKTHER
jgi:hypothetical protein